MTSPTALFTLASLPPGPASGAASLFRAGTLDECITFARDKLPALQAALPATAKRLSLDPAVQAYHALTVVLVNALAAQARWKEAKEALGRYRARLPQEPWGYTAGAEVTRRDPQMKDREAVLQAADLLEGEAERLRGLRKGTTERGKKQ